MEIIDHRTGRRFGFDAFCARVEEMSATLARLGLQAHSRVVIGEADPIEFLVALFACWECGACAIVVNPSLPEAEQARVIASVKPAHWLGACAAKIGPAPATGSPPAHEADLVLMTSGTTGNPKGVMLGKAALAYRLAENIRHIGKDVLQNGLCILPLYFGHGLIGNALTVLAAGGTLTLWPTPGLHELRALPELIEQRNIGFLSTVPSFWKLVLPLARPPQTALKRVHIGSAPLSIELWQQVAAWAGTTQVFNVFGMSETANWIAGGSLESARGRDGYIGTAWGGKLAVLAAGQVAKTGRGEVLVHNRAAMSGYLDQPEKTKDAFFDGWLRSGDIGEIDPEGALVLVGRIKSEINIGGIKVLAEEVELMMERHPGIREACAFPVSDAIAGERVGVAIVCEDGAGLSTETLVEWCLTQARKEAAPKQVYFLNQIPKNDRGKIVRADVAMLCLGQT